MIAAIAILIFLAALAACGVGFYFSCRLLWHGVSGIFAPTAPKQAAVVSPKALHETIRPLLPGWTAKLVSDHLATCQTCRDDYVSGTLSLLEPETVTRIVALVEAHDAPRVTQ